MTADELLRDRIRLEIVRSRGIMDEVDLAAAIDAELARRAKLGGQNGT